MVKRLAVLRPEDEAAPALVEEVRSAIEKGDYDRVDQLLAETEQIDLAAVRMAEDLARQAQGVAENRRRTAAAKRAERGELSLTRLDYLQAADHFRASSDILPPSDLETWAHYRNRLADALYRYGDEKGDNTVLRQSIDTYRKNLQSLSRERVPLDRSATQNNLGVALRTLGERESGTKHLQEAVDAYRGALEELTRERVPLDWAITQNNLGLALWRLGARESGTKRLEEAIDAYRAALQEWTRERVPLDWAQTQNNLGTALQRLGERESGTKRLEEAVDAYRAALQEWARTNERSIFVA